MELLTSVDAVIDTLGGTGAVARKLGLGPSAVSNWRAKQRINPELYLALQAELAAVGKTAPPSLWGMVERAS